MTNDAAEEEEDAVRALAARLAPSLKQAEALLLTHTLHSIPSTNQLDNNEYDDDMDQEMQDLQHAEDLLRRELDQVYLEEPEDLWQRHQESISDNEEEWQKTDIITPHSPSSFYMTSGEAARPMTPKTTRYRQEDHMTVLQLSANNTTALQPRNHLYRVNMTHHLSNTTCRIPIVQEWVVAPSEDTLKQMVVGLQTSTNLETSHVTTLPIRTVTIRIRPDVLCGTVMEALHHALGKQNAEIDKRQGGHMQATWSQHYDVDLQLVTEQSTLERQLLMRLFYNSHSTQESTDSLTPSKKSEQDELVDIQYLIENGLYLNDDDNEEDPNTLVSTKDAPSLHLRECAALIQRIETPQSSRKPIRLSSNPLTKQSMQQAVSTHLLENYIACPSVKEGSSTLPALNAQDYQVIQNSWPLIETIWDELDTRDLLYSSLEHSPFGAFPALPTLDVQYCGQLRRLSRDRLIQQLLKGAGELEEFAREAEYACANMIALLKPTFQLYGIPETPLPQPVSLNDYSLDFTPPHVACPPWGLSVQSALSQIQTWAKEDSEGESSMIKADNAVNLVFNALQMQDDEEQTARLDRKNRQVMDRLAAMQEHEKAMIDDIEAEATVKAILAANDFEAVAKVRQVPLVTWSFLPGTTGTGSCTVTSNFILFSTRRIPIIGGTKTQLFALKDVEFEVSTEKTSLLNPFSSFIRVLNRRQEEVFRFWPSMGAIRLKSFLDRLKINPLLETFEME